VNNKSSLAPRVRFFYYISNLFFLTQLPYNMSDEVYDGAIGIDLGTVR